MLPLPRRHAWLAGPPANTCSRNRLQNKRQHPPSVSFPSSAWECVPRSSASHSRSRNRPRNKHSPCRKAGMTSHWRECEAPLRRTQRNGADETILGGCFPSRLSPRRMSGIPQTKNLLVPSLLRRHACLTTPERVKESPKPPNPSCCRSRACERIPLRHRSNLQRKKQHRHSGIFRVADLGPGTMPRGKYPESPAPAGSHALISRTPTPGGMLHANLGLPRPPPRNFQPPLPRFPSRLSPRRMSGDAGEDSFTRSPAANTCPRNKPSKQTATAPPQN